MVVPRPILVPNPSLVTWRLVEVAIAGALLGGGATAAGGGTTMANVKIITGNGAVPSVAIIVIIVVIVALREAPRTPTVSREYRHIEGHNAVVPEVEGAPPV